MKIALVPLYVDYYEAIVPKISEAKDALIRKAVVAIGNEHEIIMFDRASDVHSANAARERLKSLQPDCVVVLPLVAAFSLIAEEVTREWRGPLVLLSAMAGTTIPKPMTMFRAVAESQSFGSQAIANAWLRRGLRFYVVHHMLGTEAGNAASRQLLQVIAANASLRRLRVGLIGEPFGGMTDVLLPAEEFQSQTGARIVKIPMKRIHKLSARVTRDELTHFEKDLGRSFLIGRFSVREKEFSFRSAIAILQVIAEQKLDCAAFNSHGADGLKSQKLGLMCALGISLATSAGCPMAEVGDLCTAFAMWLGRKLGGASYYTELDSAYISRNEWLLLNSGEYDLAWSRLRPKPRLVRNTNFMGVNGFGASVCAPLRMGAATIINFTPTPHARQPYRIQFCEGSITRDWSPEMRVSNARFQVNVDARTLYEHWLAAGPVHHSATCPGHLAHLLQLFCSLENWDCLPIC